MDIRKTEQKQTKTPIYLYIIVAAMRLAELTKSGIKAILRHITESLIVMSFVGAVMAAQTFDNGEIDGVTALLVIAVFIILAMALIKIKIIETRKGR